MTVKDFIPAEIRRHVYAAFAFIGVALGATQVGFAAADAGQPVALTVALAVYTFIGGAIGFVARGNTDTDTTPDGGASDGDAFDDLIRGN